MRVLLIAALAVATGCNKGPVLQNAPKPNPTAVAGVAAGVAAAATIADPHAAQKAEAREAEAREEAAADARTHRQPTMPGDVLDRLDHPPPAPVDAGVDGGRDAAASTELTVPSW
jgi:hypothetical protein